MCTIAVHCWYIKDTLTGYFQQIIETNISEDILGKIDKKNLSHLSDFGHKGVGGFEWISDNVEWSSKKL